MSRRKLHDHERLILRFLNKKGPKGTPHYGNVETAFEQNDGGMGSIRFRNTISGEYQKAGSCEFKDTDNLPVIVDLFIDEKGIPTELSFWKVDFKPVVRFPVSTDELSIFKWESD